MAPMPDRIDYLLKQRDQALRHADGAGVDRAGWLRIADEWQKLLDALPADLHRHAEKPDTHLLD